MSVLKRLVPGKKTEAAALRVPHGPLRLHIGGAKRHPDWVVVNVNPGPDTDVVRSCTDLSPFAAGSVSEIYASHVIEHLGYQRDLVRALREFHRVLAPGGLLRVSVPDLKVLCELFLDPARTPTERFHLMRIIYGGQIDDADFHYAGFDQDILASYLQGAGFGEIKRVTGFGLFHDTSTLELHGRPISLNMVARKAA